MKTLKNQLIPSPLSPGGPAPQLQGGPDPQGGPWSMQDPALYMRLVSRAHC